VAKLLLVEDDQELSELCKVVLESAGHEMIIAEDGEIALQLLEKYDYGFDLILSDILMPKLDGYELCVKIREHEKGSLIPFVFISALTTLEEKTKGYEAGGDDYVTKPVAMEEITYKVARLLDSSQQRSSLRQQVDYSNSAALEAISYSADLGQILEFFKKSLLAANFEELATSLFASTQAMGLRCTIQIYAPDDVLTFSDQGNPSPLETNVIDLAREESRFFDFGARTIINHDKFSLLIKNMPVDKPQRYGMLKDSLGALCNAIEERIKVLIADSVDSKKTQILTALQTAINEAKETFSTIQSQNLTAIDDLMQELESAFITLGLSEQQEDRIRKVGEECMAKTNLAFEKGEVLSERFDTIKATLEKILNIKS